MDYRPFSPAILSPDEFERKHISTVRKLACVIGVNPEELEPDIRWTKEARAKISAQGSNLNNRLHDCLYFSKLKQMNKQATSLNTKERQAYDQEIKELRKVSEETMEQYLIAFRIRENADTLNEGKVDESGITNLTHILTDHVWEHFFARFCKLGLNNRSAQSLIGAVITTACQNIYSELGQKRYAYVEPVSMKMKTDKEANQSVTASAKHRGEITEELGKPQRTR